VSRGPRWDREAGPSAVGEGRPLVGTPEALLLLHPQPGPSSPKPNPAIFNSRQLAYGLFDQSVHTKPPASSADEYAAVLADVAGVVPQNGTHPAARFGHLIGYDAKVGPWVGRIT
jgi:hypothetical protein